MASTQATSAYTYNNQAVWNILSNISNNTTDAMYEPIDKRRVSVNYPQNISYNAIYLRGDIFMNISFSAIKNIQKLDKIASLPDDWNENSAESFSLSLINKCKNIIYSLPIQPEIFPTADNSIQMEYEKENGEYLEFNIRDDRVDVYQIYADDKEDEYVINKDEAKTIRKVVDGFYARN